MMEGIPSRAILCISFKSRILCTSSTASFLAFILLQFSSIWYHFPFRHWNSAERHSTSSHRKHAEPNSQAYKHACCPMSKTSRESDQGMFMLRLLPRRIVVLEDGLSYEITKLIFPLAPTGSTIGNRPAHMQWSGLYVYSKACAAIKSKYQHKSNFKK